VVDARDDAKHRRGQEQALLPDVGRGQLVQGDGLKVTETLGHELEEPLSILRELPLVQVCSMPRRLDQRCRPRPCG